jgi:N-acetylmuramoyl-L-alanine amidase CwlA
MRELYREKWTAKWAHPSSAQSRKLLDQLKSDYGKILAELEPHQIARGLENCKHECKFPPDPAEFYRLATRVEEWEKTEHASHRDYKALPKPKCDEQIAEVAFETMKGILKEPEPVDDDQENREG